MCVDAQAQPADSPRVVDDEPLLLIVDSDTAAAAGLGRHLNRLGYRTEVANSGQAALRAAIDHTPNLILLDAALSDGDGLDVCQQLADTPQTCLAPVIVLGEIEGHDMVHETRRAGGHFFVRKPFDPNALLVLIRHSLDETVAWQES
jgi:two-component system KDP operon response regulator KdpE